METVPAAKKESAISKVLKLLLKIAVTVLCFWYISTKIDFSKAWDALLKANWVFLLLAVAAFTISKLMAAFRLNINFRNIDIHLSESNNIRLYWLGMFYNLFLPGSISGDAYKVVILTKRFKAAYKNTTAAVLLDRFSGLLALGIILSVFGMVVLDSSLMDSVLITGAILAIAILYLFIRFFLKDFLPGFFPTFLWGLAVQAFQVICLYCILRSLHISAHQPEWIFIFLVASVVSVLPISLGGGLGTREFVFVEGANYFHVDPHLAVIISLLFYVSNLLSSVWGAYFVFHQPLKENNYPAPNFGPTNQTASTIGENI